MTTASQRLQVERRHERDPLVVDDRRRASIYLNSLAWVLFAVCIIDGISLLIGATPLSATLILNAVLGLVAFTVAVIADRLPARVFVWSVIAYHLLVVLILARIRPVEVELDAKLASYGQLWTALLVVLFAVLVRLPPLVHCLLALALVNLTWCWQGFHLAMDWPGMPIATLQERSLNGLLVAIIAGVSSVATSTLVSAVEEAREELAELGSWVLERRLGAGGMGEVWAARHRMLATTAAVKLISAVGNEPDAQERFEREAKAMASLRSSHTVRIFDYGISDAGACYYVMERLDGIDLDSLVIDDGPLPPARAVHLLVQACRSLAEAHAVGLTHRDIKPANIFCCRDGIDLDFIKVLDFGLVISHRKRNAPIDDKRLTENNVVFGTPEYMAPEQARGKDVDGRSDIYALGCVAYWLLTGRPPFTMGSAMDIMVCHVNREPEPVAGRSLHPVPDQLAAVIHRCLAKRPDDRPQTCDELARELLACGCSWTPAEAREAFPWRVDRATGDAEDGQATVPATVVLD